MHPQQQADTKICTHITFIYPKIATPARHANHPHPPPPPTRHIIRIPPLCHISLIVRHLPSIECQSCPRTKIPPRIKKFPISSTTLKLPCIPLKRGLHLKFTLCTWHARSLASCAGFIAWPKFIHPEMSILTVTCAVPFPVPVSACYAPTVPLPPGQTPSRRKVSLLAVSLSRSL